MPLLATLSAPLTGAAACTPETDTLGRRTTCCAFWCTQWQAKWPQDNPACAHCVLCRADDCHASEGCCELDGTADATAPIATPLKLDAARAGVDAATLSDPIATPLDFDAARAAGVDAATLSNIMSEGISELDRAMANAQAMGAPPNVLDALRTQRASLQALVPSMAGATLEAQRANQDEPLVAALADDVLEDTPSEVASFGPIGMSGGITGRVGNAPNAGIAMEYGTASVEDGAFRITGDARAYLVRDHNARRWEENTYVRLDMSSTLTFSLDLSGVPCGCLACICASNALGVKRSSRLLYACSTLAHRPASLLVMFSRDPSFLHLQMSRPGGHARSHARGHRLLRHGTRIGHNSYTLDSPKSRP